MICLSIPDPLRSGRLYEVAETTRTLVDIGDRIFMAGRADQNPFSITVYTVPQFA